MPYRSAVLRFTSVEEILQNFKEECKILLSYAVACLPTQVILASFLGIDLVKYACQYNKLIFEMQSLMDTARPLINTYIKEANDARGLITSNTSSCIHLCRRTGRGYRTHYLKLTDGCHPVDEVKLSWAKALVNCCRMMLTE